MNFSYACRLFCFLSLLFAPTTIRAKPSWHVSKASEWPEADQLFRNDPRWRGGDGASSVDLGDGRVLWLFGDSFVSNTEVSSRKETRMINNSLAIQEGYDPVSQKMKFYWNAKGEKPQSFFEAVEETWYWPAGGVVVDDQLLIFLMKIRRADTMLGFAFLGSDGLLITNPQDSPDLWQMRPLRLPENRFQMVYGSGGFLKDENYLFAMTPRTVEGHPAYLARWPLVEIRQKNLKNVSWYNNGKWQPHQGLQKLPAPTLPNAQTEFSIHREAELNAYVQVQCAPFLDAELQIRLARQYAGPWSEPQALFDPKRLPQQPPGVFYYSGKAHPELALPESEGRSFAITYCSNARKLSTVIADESIYYPRFLKATLRSRKPDE